ncbi:MAG: hypothetical protein OXH83_19620 [Bryobacterales bacterium]|nr:hypothetical protein [Bryobacterales bacterium]
MATPDELKRIHQELDKLSAFQWDRVSRPEMGSASLSRELEPIQKDIESLVVLAKRYCKLIHREDTQTLLGCLQSIHNTLVGHAGTDERTYVHRKQDFLQSIRHSIRDVASWKATLVTTAMLDIGLFEFEDILDKIKQAPADLRKEAENLRAEILEAANVEFQRLHERFRAEMNEKLKRGEEIEAEYRKAAMEFSVKAAQQQFEEASSHDSGRVKLWTCLSVLSIGALIAAAFLFTFWGAVRIPTGLEWTDALPHALLRIFVLSALAGATTFTFRMLRAHLHIAERNRHRVRVANCIKDFLGATRDKAQRDLILAKLTDSIVNYGDSGLVQYDREDHSSTMSGDVIGRIVAAVSGKGS